MTDSASAAHQADWRFLLPAVRPTRGVSFTPGRLADTLSLVAAQTSDPHHVPDGSCDVAVAIDPDGATLEAAATALGPGGWCYTEWYSPLAMSAGAIRRRLIQAGFTDIACYWPWPPPSRGRTRQWVPLEAPGALTYFLSSRPSPRHLIVRAARAVLRRAWGVAARQGLAFPVCAVARKASPGVDPHRARRVAAIAPALQGPPLEIIRDHWNAWGFGPEPDRLSWLLLTIGVRLENKVVGLVVADPDPRPRVVVKLGRVAEVDQRLRREAETLCALAELKPGGVPGVPRLLFCEPHADGLALGQSALTGQRIFTWIRPRNARALGLIVADWSAQLIRSSSATDPIDWWPRLVDPIIANFQRLYAPVIEGGALAETLRRLRTIGALPTAIEHRDFGWWNTLLAADGTLAVLDWELAETRGLPGLDLFYFLYFLAALLDGSNRDHGFRETLHRSLDPSTLTGRIYAECVRRYCDQVGLDTSFVHPLRLLTWMLQASSDYGDIVDRCGGVPGPDDLRNGLYFALWQEELRYGERPSSS